MEELRYRPSLDETMMDAARIASRRSLCMRMGVGAVIIDSDNVVRATSYNGPPANYKGPPCRKEATLLCSPGSGEYSGCPSVHAEQNAILFAGRDACRGGTIYCTATPCADCARIVAQAGIARFVTDDTSNRPGIEFLKHSGVIVDSPKTGEDDAPAYTDVVHYVRNLYGRSDADSELIALGAVVLMASNGIKAVIGDPLSDYSGKSRHEKTGNDINHALRVSVEFSYGKFEDWADGGSNGSNMFRILEGKTPEDTLRSLGEKVRDALA